MQGVTTALVAFIFVCMAMPRLVKHRSQFYAALTAVILIIALDTLAHMFAGVTAENVPVPTAFSKLTYVVAGFLQVVSFLLLVLSVGGLSARELAGEMADAYEVIRRGSEEKEIIIPLESRPQPPTQRPPAPSPKTSDEPHKTYTLDAAGNEIETSPSDTNPENGIPLA